MASELLKKTLMILAQDRGVLEISLATRKDLEHLYGQYERAVEVLEAIEESWNILAKKYADAKWNVEPPVHVEGL